MTIHIYSYNFSLYLEPGQVEIQFTHEPSSHAATATTTATKYFYATDYRQTNAATTSSDAVEP